MRGEMMTQAPLEECDETMHIPTQQQNVWLTPTAHFFITSLNLHSYHFLTLPLIRCTKPKPDYS